MEAQARESAREPRTRSGSKRARGDGARVKAAQTGGRPSSLGGEKSAGEEHHALAATRRVKEDPTMGDGGNVDIGVFPVVTWDVDGGGGPGGGRLAGNATAEMESAASLASLHRLSRSMPDLAELRHLGERIYEVRFQSLLTPCPLTDPKALSAVLLLPCPSVRPS